MNLKNKALEELAAKGNVKAARWLINKYFDSNLLIVHRWTRVLADKGEAHAQYNLACDYENGKGFPKNLLLAVKWYKAAAKQGFASALLNLGICYAKGRGVK